MRIGLQLPSFTWPGGVKQIGASLSNIAQTADEMGFASLWVMDHFFQMDFMAPASDPMLESYATLSFLAGRTRQIKLGALVTAAVYRFPAVMVKTVTTLDVLSRGRAYFGIGAGWYQREAAGLGIPFPGWSERYERLQETLEIAKQMWSETVRPFHGKHYQLAEPINQPQPLTRPHPPILIGGVGENKTLPLVARYADACNFPLHIGMESLHAKLCRLKECCEQEGRPFDEIEKTVLGGIDLRPGKMTVAEVLSIACELSQLGFEHWILNVEDVTDLSHLELIGNQIIPAVASF